MTAAAWHPDPTGRHELRYWDGSQWTEHVSDNQVVTSDPLEGPGGGAQSTAQTSERAEESTEATGGAHAGAAESTTGGEPTGTGAVTDADQPPTEAMLVQQEPEAEAPPQQAAPQQMPQQQMPQQPMPQAAPMGGAPYGGQPAGQPAGQASPMPGISGDLISGKFGESTSNAPGPSLQNSKLLRVRLGEPFMAKQGSMVAYQGPVNFNYQGGGAAKFLKKAITGEGLSLMRVDGQGDVFLADAADNVHILQINNSGISVNGKNVLAFSASLQYDIERVKGGSMAAGGLFNTSLRGTGWVAITTDGDPVVLNAAEAPTFADANALVAWSIDLQTGLHKSGSLGGALIGRGSGELYQVTFNGHGFVIVQPSEGPVVPPHSHGSGG